MKVLISLYKGYGLGDAVQVSVVLRHLAKHRPLWSIDYQAEEGRQLVGRGIVANTFPYGGGPASTHYDAEYQITLFDTFRAWTDRPNTHVSSCLLDHFGLDWDAECGRYQVNVPEWCVGKVRQVSGIYLNGGNYGRRSSCVAIHYQGDTARTRKDLSHSSADRIREAVLGLGREPLVLDYRNQSLLRGFRVANPEWGTSAEMQCAVISQCEAFVGVDSGPAKCASATDVPSLIVWTGHHPAAFHDPAPNTAHLVPRDRTVMHPLIEDDKVLDWFEANYSVRYYTGDPVPHIQQWLGEVLK